MRQPSVLQLLGHEPPASPKKRSFVDLFCGVGGASEGARQAGYRVVLAVDSSTKALKWHKRNHKKCKHMSLELPATLQFPEKNWHLHGSPPCQSVSLANQGAKKEYRDRAVRLIRWFVETAVKSSAESWSMEQVPTKAVRDVMEELKSELRGKVAYVVLDLSSVGIPQQRKRLIAGPPSFIAAVQRIERTTNGVDKFVSPRGTHTRSNAWRSGPKVLAFSGETRRLYGDGEGARPVSLPALTTTASHSLRWWTAGQRESLFTVREAALLQTFPPTYKLPSKRALGIRLVGNAVPPHAMRQLLS